MTKTAYFVLRAFFILLLLTTALGKLLDNRGFAAVIDTYQFGIPEPLLLPLALGVSLFELGLASSIILGAYLRQCAILTILMHLGYTLMAIITNFRGIEILNCGCFGVFLARPMTWFTVVEDLILTALSVAFYLAIIRYQRNPQPQLKNLHSKAS